MLTNLFTCFGGQKDAGWGKEQVSEACHWHAAPRGVCVFARGVAWRNVRDQTEGAIVEATAQAVGPGSHLEDSVADDTVMKDS